MLNAQQWLVVGAICVFAVAMYFWTAYQGRRLDHRLRKPPGE